ncbi:MAG: glycine betaine ABC transporter substrate-binding protein [Actinomycetes bacterium]|jgi:osmoprotectant transport system substrate-binding protein
MTRFIRVAVVGVASLLFLAACGGDDESPTTPGATSAGITNATVGSANFTESELLAEIYAAALEAKGVTVDRQLGIGAREVTYGQLQSGDLTIMPEYNGALLQYLDQNATAATTDEVNTALKAALPPELEILDSAPAEDKDSLTVTQETASQNNLQSIEDLAAVSKDMIIGGPPEMKQRREQQFKDVYGLEFKEWQALDVGGPLTVTALKDGNVQVANLFTTDPAIVDNNFVVLEDTKNVFGAQNVTPLVFKAGVDQNITDTLNAVSAKLDTQTLTQLVSKVATDHEDADQVAKDWLNSVGLG